MNAEEKKDKTLIIVTSLRDNADVAGAAIAKLKAVVSGPLADMGYTVVLHLTDDASQDSTRQIIESATEDFIGEIRMVTNEERQYRGGAFVAGVRSAYRLLEERQLKHTMIILCDLCANAPHDSEAFPRILDLLRMAERRVVFGSCYYHESRTLDSGLMRLVGKLQCVEYGTTGYFPGVWNPGLIAARADVFSAGVRNFEVYRDHWQEYSSKHLGDEGWPKFGIPGAMLHMMCLTGAEAVGIELKILGNWRPGRNQEKLSEYLWPTMKHLMMVDWMRRDGLFTT